MTDLVPVSRGIEPARIPQGRRQRLSGSARARLRKSVSKETLKAYQREWERFLQWCADEDEIALPADTDAVSNWVADRCDAGDGVSAIAQGIAAVMFFHDQAGLAKELMPDTKDAWKIHEAYRRDLADSGVRTRQAAVITPEQLRQMISTLQLDKPSGIRDRAILTLGMSSLARRMNIMLLTVEDLSFPEPGKARIFIAKSKTDQAARGQYKILHAGDHELSDPVGALRAWKAYLDGHGVCSGPLFRRISWAGNVLPYRMNPEWVSVLVKQTTKDAGIQCPPGQRFSAHTLRASGATAAARAGKPFPLICELGGWSEKSLVAHRYVRAAEEDGATKGVGL